MPQRSRYSAAGPLRPQIAGGMSYLPELLDVHKTPRTPFGRRRAIPIRSSSSSVAVVRAGLVKTVRCAEDRFTGPSQVLNRIRASLAGSSTLPTRKTRSLVIRLSIFPPATGMSFSATRSRLITYLQWAASLRARSTSCTRATTTQHLPWIGCSRLTGILKPSPCWDGARGQWRRPFIPISSLNTTQMPPSRILPTVGGAIAWAKCSRRSSNPGGQRIS